MTTPPTTRPRRILVIGRSPGVILEAAGILRSRGFHADATNHFDAVLTDYDTTSIDVVVFGGMVAPNTKQHLEDEISTVNGHVAFVQGLAGIPGLIAAQVEGVTADSGHDDVAFDPSSRTVELTVRDPAQVVVDAWWATSFTPPEPTSTSIRVIDVHLEPGKYAIPVPDEVPPVASFVTVSIGPAVHAFTVGAMPETVRRTVPHRDRPGHPRSPPSERWRPTPSTDLSVAAVVASGHDRVGRP